MIQRQREYNASRRQSLARKWIFVSLCVLGANCGFIREDSHSSVSQVGKKDSTDTDATVDEFFALGQTPERRKKSSDNLGDVLETLFRVSKRERTTNEPVFSEDKQQLQKTQDTVVHKQTNRNDTSLEETTPTVFPFSGPPAPKTGVLENFKDSVFPAHNSSVLPDDVKDASHSENVKNSTHNQSSVSHGTKKDVGGHPAPNNSDHFGNRDVSTRPLDRIKHNDTSSGGERVKNDGVEAHARNETARVNAAIETEKRRGSHCEGCVGSSEGDKLNFPSDEGDGEADDFDDDSPIAPYFIIDAPNRDEENRCVEGQRFFRGRCRRYRP